jgi:hypothetical protein
MVRLARRGLRVTVRRLVAAIALALFNDAFQNR